MAGKRTGSARQTAPDLRQEIARRARDPAIAADIADAVIREAGTGGNQGKGGASVLKAYEMVQEIVDQMSADGGSPDYSRMTDDRLRALLHSLEEP